MNFILFISLLLFAYSSSFSISKWKQPYHREIHRQDERPNNNEVYKVEHSTDSLEFIYPKARAPTLREIVYYHVIERPREGGSGTLQDSSSYSGSVEDDAVATERPFTNGHGYPFLPEPGHKEQQYEVATEIEPATNDTTTYKETEEYTSTAKEEEEREVANESVNGSTTDDKITEITTESSIDEIVEEKRNTRADLFSQAKEKYQNRRMDKKQHRRKRHLEASDIPAAPTLRPLNLDSLPEYARKLLSIQKTTTEKSKLEEPETNEAALKKEIQDRIEEMMATLKPAVLEDDIPERDGSIEEEHGKKKIARTYGMNLTEDKGYIWNDLLGDPGMFIQVGDLEVKNEITQHNKPTKAPSVVTSSAHDSAESKPIHAEHLNERDTDQENKSEDFDDIFVEVKTNRPTDLIEHSTKKDIKNNIEQHTEKSSDTTIREDAHTDSVTESNKPTTKSSGNDANEGDLQIFSKESDHDVTAVQKHGDETGTDNIDKGHENIGNMNEKARKAITDITQSELLQELLKNEQFWKWLGDWTNTYTELLMKHVKHMIHEEVGRQMKNYTAKLKKEIQKDIEEASRLKEKESAKKDKKKSNDKSDDNTHEDTSTVKHSKESKALENETQNHEDVKIIIDGKELALTHNSNSKGDNRFKHRKDKEIGHKNPASENVVTEQKGEFENKGSKPTIAVTAQNVYGNSAGSDKVTNIFLFYPRDDFINDFRPTDDGDSPVIDKRKEDDIADLVAERDESTSTTDVPSKEVTTKSSSDDDVDVTEKPDAVENNSEVTTQTAPNASKDIEKNSNEQQEHVKDKDDTTEAKITSEATTLSNESVSVINNENNSLKSKDNTKKKEHEEKISNNKSITDEPSKDLKKGTEHNVSEKNVDTDTANEDNTEKSAIAPTGNSTESTERAAVEHKDIVVTSSAESESKGAEATV